MTKSVGSLTVYHGLRWINRYARIRHTESSGDKGRYVTRTGRWVEVPESIEYAPGHEGNLRLEDVFVCEALIRAQGDASTGYFTRTLMVNSQEKSLPVGLEAAMLLGPTCEVTFDSGIFCNPSTLDADLIPAELRTAFGTDTFDSRDAFGYFAFAELLTCVGETLYRAVASFKSRKGGVTKRDSVLLHPDRVVEAGEVAAAFDFAINLSSTTLGKVDKLLGNEPAISKIKMVASGPRLNVCLAVEKKKKKGKKSAKVEMTLTGVHLHDFLTFEPR